jgi:hypothetical protein
MDNQELIERLRHDIEDWNEQARLWESLGTATPDAVQLARRCREKAEEWNDVIRYLESKEHA